MIFGLVFWLPGALTRYTASILPEVAEDAIGESILTQVGRVTGLPCRGNQGLRALDRLETRLFPGGTHEIIVLPSALNGTAYLPGGRILVDHRLVEDVDTPNVIANAVLSEHDAQSGRPVMQNLLDSLGVRSALRLLTTGTINEDALARFAERLVATSEPVAIRTTAPDTGGPVLSDSDWIALQQICEN